MRPMGLTISNIFEASSANYGEGVGNVTALKKISRGNGEAYSYISRQAIRYEIVNQMEVANTRLGLDGSVIQFAPEATIKEYPEIDLFGYMKTVKPAKTRSAVVRLSNAISLETFNGDLDFLTNKGLLDRYNKQEGQSPKDGGNIAQSEIHKSYYAYTITIDLDKVGVDENDGIDIENSEKERRVNRLLDTVKFLYRDIKGRREDLKPLFSIGGVYEIKNPFFEGKLKIEENKLRIETIKDILQLDDRIKGNTECGLIKGIFSNCGDIQKELSTLDMGVYFENLKKKVTNYYKGL
ncbi:MAG: type I-B CRISPR-associated protein Cas7/Cst2/DevR [Gottschalkiaceae bacterium]|nr:MAG: type I-B CRISPR-associated protein Cas7/Cst2/DevR [Gottschalkiaceae bacterium]